MVLPLRRVRARGNSTCQRSRNFWACHRCCTSTPRTTASRADPSWRRPGRQSLRATKSGSWSAQRHRRADAAAHPWFFGAESGTSDPRSARNRRIGQDRRATIPGPLPVHLLRQPGDELGPDEAGDDREQLDDHERDDADIDVPCRDILRHHALQVEEREADGRRQERGL